MDQRRPRSPGVVFGLLALVVIVLIGSLALSRRNPSPPTIAEFAPQAVETITDVDASRTSSADRSAQGTGDAGDGGAAKPAASPIDVARVRQCVGEPPRQIEDPQSPPCVPYWAGDNGGATTKGVTRDEVRIFAPLPNQSALASMRPAVASAMATFFNRRFEFYGRSINLIVEPDAEKVPPNALAVKADEEHRVFASVAFGWGDYDYGNELARRRVIYTSTSRTPNDNATLRDGRPYRWSYTMPTDGMLANTGQWICGRLAGSSASHAGASESVRSRVFGVIAAVPETLRFEQRVLDDELARCGVRIPDGASQRMTRPTGEAAQNAMLQMKTLGVTSLICFCDYIDIVATFANAASGQGYFPEWLLTSFGDVDTEVGMKNPVFRQTPEQMQHAFGLTFRPRQQKLVNSPHWWAVQDIDPAMAPEYYVNIYFEQEFYRSLLLLASGIQMAGPRLTPETFDAALHRTKFPNPASHLMPGRVGFAPDSYGMTIDAAEWWWSEAGVSPYASAQGTGQQTGTFCYVDGGARHALGSWSPGEDRFFQGPCDSGV